MNAQPIKRPLVKCANCIRLCNLEETLERNYHCPHTGKDILSIYLKHDCEEYIFHD